MLDSVTQKVGKEKITLLSIATLYVFVHITSKEKHEKIF